MKIKSHREVSNLSCSEAAALIGECNIRTWKRWEAAEHMPQEKYQSLKLYARLYRAMIAEFKRGGKWKTGNIDPFYHVFLEQKLRLKPRTIRSLTEVKP